jgi:hypothetical protein
MRSAQILVYESDGQLAELLREPARERAWWLREVRHPASCLRLLRGGAGVLVLKIGRDLTREMALLEQAAWLFPDTAAVVVGDGDNPALAGLAWDLGASYVLAPPQPRNHLAPVVAGLMGS